MGNSDCDSRSIDLAISLTPLGNVRDSTNNGSEHLLDCQVKPTVASLLFGSRSAFRYLTGKE